MSITGYTQHDRLYITPIYITPIHTSGRNHACHVSGLQQPKLQRGTGMLPNTGKDFQLPGRHWTTFLSDRVRVLAQASCCIFVGLKKNVPECKITLLIASYALKIMVQFQNSIDNFRSSFCSSKNSVVFQFSVLFCSVIRHNITIISVHFRKLLSFHASNM